MLLPANWSTSAMRFRMNREFLSTDCKSCADRNRQIGDPPPAHFAAGESALFTLRLCAIVRHDSPKVELNAGGSPTPIAVVEMAVTSSHFATH